MSGFDSHLDPENMSTPLQLVLDRVAIGLSAACALHCVLAPIARGREEAAMQLDIFEHSRGVMLRNYVAQALEQDDAAFVQINGDVIQALNRSQVEAALRHTKSARASYAHTAAHRFRPRMRAQWL